MLELAKVEGCTHFPGTNAETGKSSKGVILESVAAEDATFLKEEAISDHCEIKEEMRVGFENESKSAVSESKRLRVSVFKFESIKKKLEEGETSLFIVTMLLLKTETTVETAYHFLINANCKSGARFLKLPMI